MALFREIAASRTAEFGGGRSEREIMATQIKIELDQEAFDETKAKLLELRKIAHGIRADAKEVHRSVLLAFFLALMCSGMVGAMFGVWAVVAMLG